MSPTLGLGQPDIGCFTTGHAPWWWTIGESVIASVIVLFALSCLIVLAPFMVFDGWLRRRHR